MSVKIKGKQVAYRTTYIISPIKVIIIALENDLKINVNGSQRRVMT